MTVRGTLRADGLAVARITVDFLVNPVKVHALAALIHTEGGQTLGWSEGEASTWSPETMKKLQELRDAMEGDLAGRLFHERQDGSAVTDTAPSGMNLGGLGEHLGEPVDAPSI